MSKFLVIACVFCLATSCKEKSASLSGEQKVDLVHFVAAFPKLTFPFRISDSNLAKAADTTVVSYTVFSAFIPDTALKNAAGENIKTIKINPVGKIEKENELYLLANFTQNKNTVLHVFILNKANKYLSHLELLKQRNKDAYVHSVSITSEPTFIISREKINQQNELQYTRDGYAYTSNPGVFIAVINDSNEDIQRTNEIINPIDTFAQKNKWSGDYIKDKRNFISVRDGSNINEYLFFIHFEKTGNCNGELKGEMTLRDAANAYYQQTGDPCVIDFTFGSKNVKVKEQGNCGNHRGTKCFFDDTYKKKKEAKQSKSK